MRIVFTFFVGAILALFVGFGIHTFYPPPEPPDTALVQLKANPTDAEVAEASAAQKAYDTAYQSYSRHVSIVSMGGAVLFLALSLGLERKNKVMANGILLGGLFTLVYGVARGFVSRDTTTLFITLSVALALVMVLGFRRFRRPQDEAPVTGPADQGPPGGASDPKTSSGEDVRRCRSGTVSSTASTALAYSQR